MSASEINKTTNALDVLEGSIADSIDASTGPSDREVSDVLRPQDLQVAHELRTPLTALKSAIDLLCQSDLPTDSAHIARIAQRNVDRMAEIVEDMLTKRSSKS